MADELIQHALSIAPTWVCWSCFLVGGICNKLGNIINIMLRKCNQSASAGIYTFNVLPRSNRYSVFFSVQLRLRLKTFCNKYCTGMGTLQIFFECGGSLTKFWIFHIIIVRKTCSVGLGGLFYFLCTFIPLFSPLTATLLRQFKL
jgi:hypothetical protein